MFFVRVRVYKCLRTGDIKVRGEHRKAGLGTCFLVRFGEPENILVSLFLGFFSLSG